MSMLGKSRMVGLSIQRVADDCYNCRPSISEIMKGLMPIRILLIKLLLVAMQ